MSATPSISPYNQYNIEDNDKGTLGKQAAWLSRYPSVRADHRRPLRRTRHPRIQSGAGRPPRQCGEGILVSQGVSAGRLETISYGKERPICTESSEDCWAQNRRGVSTITGGANS